MKLIGFVLLSLLLMANHATEAQYRAPTSGAIGLAADGKSLNIVDPNAPRRRMITLVHDDGRREIIEIDTRTGKRVD
jgi:hypothetical protein